MAHVLVFASVDAIGPAVIAGCFMTFNSVLTIVLTRRLGNDERVREVEREVERVEEKQDAERPK